ncbi:MAG: iron ABC transporter permease [Enterococcaceae bacterium]|jgi:iron complex transport system permease protein|nr:iron ABC transporter permease [Enterococcaceae bacterium]MCI1918675.1 iron ABC transporter permease [Enterococcaceae bacterium]
MKSRKRYVTLIIGLAILLIAAVIFSFCMGRYVVSVPTTLETLWKGIFFGKDSVKLADYNVIFHLRMARIVGAVFIGAALAASGSTYQSVFRNPLAAPELLGVFHGACVGAALAILMSGSVALIQVLALIGGLAAVGLTLMLTRFFHNNSTATLVLAGVITTGLMRSILGLLKYVADPETQLPSITYWELGSLANLTLATFFKIAPTMFLTFLALYLLRWRFNVLSLGDEEAQVLGENVKKIRFLVVFLSTLLTSCAVSLGGNIMWVGLVIPQLGRMIVGPDNTRLLPVTAFMGAIFLLIIDTLARSIAGVEIPLSILTGIIGAPIFIILVFGKSRKEV